MRVKTNNESLFVDWKYENPDLQLILDENGISMERYQLEGGKKIMELINGKLGNEKINSLPAPTLCYCVIRRQDDNSVVTEAFVRKHKNDQFSYKKARSYSLAKALRQIFPHLQGVEGKENKATRREFWDTYLGKKQLETV